MKQPLEGVRVIDCGIYHAGPGGPAILGDLGAEVIKIEPETLSEPSSESERLISKSRAVGVFSLKAPTGTRKALPLI